MLIFMYYRMKIRKPSMLMAEQYKNINSYLCMEVLNALSADYLKRQIKTGLLQSVEGATTERHFGFEFDLQVLDAETLAIYPGVEACPDACFEYKVKASDFLIALEIWTVFLRLGGFEEGWFMVSFWNNLWDPPPPGWDRLVFGGVKDAIRQYLAFIRSSTNPLLLKMSDKEAFACSSYPSKGVEEVMEVTRKIVPVLPSMKLKEYQEQFRANNEARETLLEWLDQGPQAATVLSVDHVKFERHENGYLMVTDDAYPTDHMLACTPQEFREAIEECKEL